jgi:hypothetical protein
MNNDNRDLSCLKHHPEKCLLETQMGWMSDKLSPYVENGMDINRTS